MKNGIETNKWEFWETDSPEPGLRLTVKKKGDKARDFAVFRVFENRVALESAWGYGHETHVVEMLLNELFAGECPKEENREKPKAKG